jgi:uncharacterized protein (DUF1697 family)
MARYLALLGSINVGGNRLSMADLRDALEREEFEGVETVVASGNVLFDHEERPVEGLAEKIAWIVADRFDIRSAVVVLDRAALAAAIAENPFSGVGEDKFVHTHFLTCQPTEAQFAALMADHAGRGGEKLAPGTRALHIDFGDGVAGSKLTGAFMDKRLGCSGTARNMRSLRRILAKMEGADGA